MKLKRMAILALLFAMITGYWVNPVSAQEGIITETSQIDGQILGSCGIGEVTITEIDYDEPGSADKYEFIELNGEPYTDLSQYELRFIASDRAVEAPIDSIPLTDIVLSQTGYLVISTDNLNVYDDSSHLVIDQTDFIFDEEGGIGIYDLEEDEYCAFINYVTAQDGYGDWLNIGTDDPQDGIGRGCRRSLAGWWSCNRISTPGGSNTVVAVTIGDLATEAAPSSAPKAALATLGLGVAAAFVWTRRK